MTITVYDKLGKTVNRRLTAAGKEPYFSAQTVRLFNSFYKDDTLNLADIAPLDKATAHEAMFVCCLGRLPDDGAKKACAADKKDKDAYLPLRLKGILNSNEYKQKRRETGTQVTAAGNFFSGARAVNSYQTVNLPPKQIPPQPVIIKLPENHIAPAAPEWDRSIMPAPVKTEPRVILAYPEDFLPDSLQTMRRGGLYRFYKKLPKGVRRALRRMFLGREDK